MACLISGSCSETSVYRSSLPSTELWDLDSDAPLTHGAGSTACAGPGARSSRAAAVDNAVGGSFTLSTLGLRLEWPIVSSGR